MEGQVPLSPDTRGVRAIRWAAGAVILLGTLLVATETYPSSQSIQEAWGHLAGSGSATEDGSGLVKPSQEVLLARLAACEAEKAALLAQLALFDAEVKEGTNLTRESTQGGATALPQAASSQLPTEPEPSLQPSSPSFLPFLLVTGSAEATPSSSAAPMKSSQLPLCGTLNSISSAAWAAGGSHPFSTQSCRYVRWNISAARQCMRGRRLFTVGNSVAREFHFNTLSAFCEKLCDGLTVEKARCREERGLCSERCNGALDSTFGTAFSYIFQNRMGPLPPGFNYHQPDACPDSAEDCIDQALNGSLPGDVLVFFNGLHLAWEFKHVTRLNVNVAPPPGAGYGAPEVREYPIFDAIGKDAATSWRSILKRSWKGRASDVFRVRLAPLCIDNCNPMIYTREFLESTSTISNRLNNLFDDQFASEPWGVVDQWAINNAMQPGSGYLPHYRDFVHYEHDPLDVTFDMILSRLCVQ